MKASPTNSPISGTSMKSRFVSLIYVMSIVAAAISAAAQESRPAGISQAQPNSIGLQLIRIPAGEFWMGGSEPAEDLVKAFPNSNRKPEDFADEYPRHRVQITKPFSIGRYEVTIGQFRQFTD